jgi:hypothetical protein
LALGLFFTLLAACGEEVAPTSTEASEVYVTLNVAAQPMEAEAETRATAPLVPDVENLFYDVWVLQYVKENNNYASLAKSHCYHLDADITTGRTKLTLPELSFLGVESYICVIANRLNDGTAPATVDDIFDSVVDANDAGIFSNFQTTRVALSLPDINAGLVDRFLLCGYWEGTPTANTAINIVLGRMMTRLNVTLENESSTDFSGTVQLLNASKMAYLFPSTEAGDLPDSAYTDELVDEEVSIAAGASVSLYYYTAPNFCSSEDYASKILITNDNKQGATIVLGTDAPGTSNRDLNLYHNTIYNFTITLTDPE